MLSAGNKTLLRSFRRYTLITIALAFFLLSEYQPGSGAEVFILVPYGFVYFWLFANRGRGWNGLEIVVLPLFLMAGVAIGYFAGGEYPGPNLLWPLIFFLAVPPKKFEWTARGLAACAGIEIVIFTYSGSVPYAALFAVFGVYMAIQGRARLKNAYSVIQQQLKELNKTHEELQEAHKQLQEATVNSMRYAALSERTRIARDIHDGLGHHLTSMIVQLQALEMMLESEPQAAPEAVGELIRTARAGMQEVRLAVHEWKEDESGLGLAALRGLISQTSANTNLRIHWEESPGLSDWDPAMSIALYRILQEALTNVLRHAEADEVKIRLLEEDDLLKITLQDNGSYRHEPGQPLGFGQQGIQERCQSVGGTCRFGQNEPSGLTLTIELPLRQPDLKM
ncbi:sensor histidine kinase [Paenibacillus physcomitrellae]|uniref:histidine kinase n=1 Tax=Paenibacillus physcomitrellae TaxID=1619311 RepID=A0ABQ1FZI5_9BACL|nr:sensor histidine kinase [Paenibacillus physcomitrellae]GGA33731.1 hypothetical protein GCM10010917_18710 [Paenibacillus physcomitrellae]